MTRGTISALEQVIYQRWSAFSVSLITLPGFSSTAEEERSICSIAEESWYIAL